MEQFGKLVESTALHEWMLTTEWLWPWLEIIHFFGLSLLLGALLVIDLRMAGFFRQINIKVTHSLLPWVFAGFGLNVVTGVLFFFGDPMRYAINIGFQFKMGLFVLAGLNALLYWWQIHDEMNSWAPDINPPLLAKTIAIVSLGCWTGVLLLGRLIPYVGTG